MPITVSHALSATTPDDPNYEIQPKHWNSGHLATFNAVGSEISGAFSNGGNVTFGLETNGYLTASAPAGGGGLTNINVSAGTTSNNLSNFVFSNSNGVSFGLNGSTVTATVRTDYLTTAMASNRGTDFVQATAAFAGTNANGTVASNGISVSVPAQTAFVFSNGNGVSFGTNGSTVTATVATNYLTTAAQSNQVVNSINGSTGVFSFNTGSSLSSSRNGNSITFGLASNITTALQSTGNYLTTARASNDAVGLNTAQSNVTWTVNSAGISLNANGYAGTGLSLTNATATLNSNGLQLSVGGGGVTNQTGPNIAAGGVTVTDGTVVFSNSNGVSFGIAGSTMTASVAAGGFTQSGYNHYNDVVQVAGQVGQGTLQIDPINLDFAVQFDRFGMPIVNTNATNSSGSHTLSFWIGLYTRNDSTLSLYQSTSGSTAATHSGTVGSYSIYSGMRLFTIPFTTTLPPADYWLAVVSRTTSGGANGTYSQMLQSNLGTNFQGFFGASNNTTQQFTLGQGVYTVTTSGIPGSIAFSQIRGSDSAAARPPIVVFYSSTV